MIEGPLRPCVVIAGAGSGKTETMAARVVWLDRQPAGGTRPGARADLHPQGGGRVGQPHPPPAGPVARGRGRDRTDDTASGRAAAGEPTVLTYAAYAGRLVGEHALRLGREPSPRLLSQAVRWQLADSVVRRYGRRPARRHRSAGVGDRSTSRLAGQLADHLVTPDDVAGPRHGRPRRLGSLAFAARPGPATPKATAGYVKATGIGWPDPRGAGVRERQGERGGVDYGDQMSLAAALAQVPDVAPPSDRGIRAVLLDEYQGHRPRAGHAAVGAVRPGPSGHRGRRSTPVDLRLAGGGRGEHRPVCGDVPARRRLPGDRVPAGDELAQRRADPGGRERGRPRRAGGDPRRGHPRARPGASSGRIRRSGDADTSRTRRPGSPGG